MNEKNNNHLTELILTIHNEIQSAVDYISSVSSEKGTELGKSSAVMGIENFKMKVPLYLVLEKFNDSISDDIESPTLEQVQHSLFNRKGFLVNIEEQENIGAYTKIRVNESEVTNSLNVLGEIEISFAPMKRE